MTDDASTPSAPQAHDQEQMQQLVDDTRRKLDELVATQKAARNSVTMATIAIVVIVVGFGTKAWFTVQENLNKQRLVAVAEQRSPELIASAKRALMQTQERVLPAYQDEAVRRMGELAPRMLEVTEAQLVDLPDAIRTDVESQLQAVLERVRGNVVGKLHDKFPYMTEAKIEENLADLEGYAQLHAEAVRTRLEALQVEEAQRVEAVLVKFPIPNDVSTIEKGEITKDLIQSVLEYALWEVEVSGTDAGLDWAAITDFSAWNIK